MTLTFLYRVGAFRRKVLKRAANITPCQAVFYTWEELSDLYTAILSGYFERPIPVGVTGDERGNGSKRRPH